MMNEELQNELNKLSKNHLIFKQKLEELKFKDDSIKNQIKIICESENINYFKDSDGYSVNISNQTRTSFDKNIAKTFLSKENFNECLKEGNSFSVLKWKKLEGNE